MGLEDEDDSWAGHPLFKPLRNAVLLHVKYVKGQTFLLLVWFGTLKKDIIVQILILSSENTENNIGLASKRHEN